MSRDIRSPKSGPPAIMDRKERRRRKRLEDKLKKKNSAKASSPPHKDHKEFPPSQSWASRYFSKTISRTKVLWTLVAAVLAMLAGFALFRPQVSLEPDLLLNPGDPFSTQFSVTNLNRIFTAKDLQPACYTLFVRTSNDVELRGLPPRPSPVIPALEPGEKTTIDCPPWIGGMGAGAGNVLAAYIEIDISYKQDGWPLTRTQRFPFKGMVDSKNGVHWTHRTPSDLR
jgi:hypothetical protein